MLWERSAGGLVIRGEKILMIQVKNLEGRIVWTLPKGHIEKGESAKKAALREVYEETGWKCGVLPALSEVEGSSRAFAKAPHDRRSPTVWRVQYQFKRGRMPVRKEVSWYLMRAISKVKKRDPEEVLRAAWFTLRNAGKKVLYNSDKKLLDNYMNLRK